MPWFRWTHVRHFYFRALFGEHRVLIVFVSEHMFVFFSQVFRKNVHHVTLKSQKPNHKEIQVIHLDQDVY
jgi:hypothetical protein